MGAVLAGWVQVARFKADEPPGWRDLTSSATKPREGVGRWGAGAGAPSGLASIAAGVQRRALDLSLLLGSTRGDGDVGDAVSDWWLSDAQSGDLLRSAGPADSAGGGLGAGLCSARVALPSRTFRGDGVRRWAPAALLPALTCCGVGDRRGDRALSRPAWTRLQAAGAAQAPGAAGGGGRRRCCARMGPGVGAARPRPRHDYGGGPWGPGSARQCVGTWRQSGGGAAA